MMDVTGGIDLVPGDILAMDFEILAQNPTLEREAISRLKRQVWEHPQLDYQSMKTMPVGSLELGREVTLLRVWAKVRQTDKATREQIQYANANYIGFGIVAAVVSAGLAIVLRQATRLVEVGTDAVDDAGTLVEVTDSGVKLGVVGVLILLALAWWLLR